jgi:hypothetical protein
VSGTTEDPVEEAMGDPTEFFLGLMKERTPEKASALQEVVNQHCVHFQVDHDSDRCHFTADAETGRIVVGLKGTARLTGHCYAYTCSLHAFYQRNSGLTAEPDQQALKAGSEVFRWAVTGDIRSKLNEFDRSFISDFIPDNLWDLIDECLPDQQRAKAGEVLADALTWILYHEVSHIQTGHTECEGLESVEQEREADRLAAEWMLDSDEIGNLERYQRLLGIATALGWLTAPTAVLGPGSRTTHPAAYDRLYQTLDQFIPEEVADIWIFVQMMLVLHILFAGLPFNGEHIGPPLKENASLLVDVIARRGKR